MNKQHSVSTPNLRCLSDAIHETKIQPVSKGLPEAGSIQDDIRSARIVAHKPEPDGLRNTAQDGQIEPPSLTVRRPGEILGMKFNDDDLYLKNGIFAKGQPLTLLGPGGIGKSRLLLQLVVCLASGRQFLGWDTTTRPLKCLVLQGENSNRRLYADLAGIRKWVGEDSWTKVEANLVLHTLENDIDGLLSLTDHPSKERLAHAVKAAGADVVVFDPLYAFALGNLNTDAAMRKTCEAISELAKLGNPDVAIIIVHHALTGKAGAQKATGFDRASFGRGSKALQFWTRGQINVAPANENDNTRLVVACGKNSNGPDFQPFGIALNPGTMTYEIDPEFELEKWKMEIGGGSSSDGKATPEGIAALVKDLPLGRKDLTALIMEEFMCGKSTAYNLIKNADGKSIRRNNTRKFEAVPTETDKH